MNSLYDQIRHLLIAGDFSRAEDICTSELQKRPSDFYVLRTLAQISLQKGDLVRGIHFLDRAVRANPKSSEAHHDLALALAMSGDHNRAIRHFQRSIKLNPTAAAWKNLGATCLTLGDNTGAIDAFTAAAKMVSGDASIHHNLSLAHHRAGNLDVSVCEARKAIELSPGQHDGYYQLGSVLRMLGRSVEAEAALREAFRLAPNLVSVMNGLGASLYDLGKFEEASKLFEAVISREPDHPDAHHNLAMLHLMLGRYASGWTEFEYRKTASTSFGNRQFDAPLWTGDFDLRNKKILVHWEQGFGDTIQFSRYLAELKRLAAEVLFMPQPVLTELCSSLPVPIVSEAIRKVDYDAHCPLMSLPFAMRNHVPGPFYPGRYLSSHPERRKQWAERLQGGGFKIGISWHASNFVHMRDKSMPLQKFERLGKVPGVRLISLQKFDGSEELRGLDFPVEHFADLDAGGQAFVDTAAIIDNLDLVISVDTSIAHLAGALGAPTWILLKKHADWRWQTERTDTPWYPSARLFRQTEIGDWDSVMTDVGNGLEGLLQAHKGIA